ncbi:MAG: glycosyltransferase family 4 protein [Chloroflexi bacterium]|nr:glycosyltransferase family 4 protein [Chloroflexota bacterium]
MRIGLITPGFDAHEGDWAIPALSNLVRELGRRHDVRVFALRYPHRRGWYEVFGVEVQALGGAETRGPARGALLTRALMALRRSHEERPFDALHGFWADEPGFLAVLAARWWRIPAIVSVMGGELVGFADIGYGGQLSRIGRGLIRFSLARADRVTVGSGWLAERARRWTREERLSVAPLGVDAARFRPDGRVEKLVGSPALLHAASLVPIKDQATLLAAFARLRANFPDAHLHMIGGGPLREKLTDLARTLGAFEHITFHGPVLHPRLPPFYRGADLFLLSSRFESQNLAVLEALACGCPVAGTRVGVLPELLPANCLAPPGDAAALADAAASLLADEPGRAALAAKLSQRVRREYALTSTLHKLEHIAKALYN